MPFRRGDVKGRSVGGNSVNGDNIWTWYTSSTKELRFLLFSLGFNLLLLFCLICFRLHCYLFTCFSAVWLFLLPLLLLGNTEHSLCSRHSLKPLITFFKLSASCLWNSTLIIPFYRWGSKDVEKLRGCKTDRWWHVTSAPGLPGDRACFLSQSSHTLRDVCALHVLLGFEGTCNNTYNMVNRKVTSRRE